MKAVVYDAARSYAVKDIPTPQAAAGQVRIKVDQVGVCGTDLHIHEGDFNAVFPLIPGHELVARVSETSPSTAPATRSGRSSTRTASSCGRSQTPCSTPLRPLAWSTLGSSSVVR